MGLLGLTKKKAAKNVPLIRQVQFDIVNKCNLRCPFCMVNHTKEGSSTLMDEAMFIKIMTLISHVGRGHFGMSCLFEPTLHPRFMEFIYMVPQEYREKIFFTTNLARPLTDDFIEKLAASGIAKINISMDSMKPEVFSVLRKGGELVNFKHNLERLVDALERNNAKTVLHYITVLNKQNLAEFPEILKNCYEKYRASSVEVREVRIEDHFIDDWGTKNALTDDEWNNLLGIIESMPYKCTMKRENAETKSGAIDVINTNTSAYRAPVPAKPPKGDKGVVKKLKRPFVIRINSDGKTRLRGVSTADFLTYINKIDGDLYSFFEKL